MSRLIDTDVFRKRIDRYPPEIRDIVKKELRYTPTVERRKTGEWINVNQGKWNCVIVYKCSNCNEICYEMPIYADAVPAWNFCPYCQSYNKDAYMRGEQE